VKTFTRSVVSGANIANGSSNSKLDSNPSWAAPGSVDFNRTRETVGLHPSVPYQPVPGLVALFARTAGSSTRNPRAPHTRPCAATGFSYAAVVSSPMDSGRFNGGNRGTAQRIRRARQTSYPTTGPSPGFCFTAKSG
jgi:hypothetical protein